jgi:hypothetical protein
MQRKAIHNIPGNKTKTRQQTFAEGSLERKAKAQAKKQARWDAQTERMAKYLEQNKQPLRTPEQRKIVMDGARNKMRAMIKKKEGQMNNHDLLVLNNTSYTSGTFNRALEDFQNSDRSDWLDKGDSEESLLDTGFEYGFWAAVRILTGFEDGN